MCEEEAVALEARGSGRIGRVGRNVPLDGGANRRDVDALAWVV